MLDREGQRFGWPPIEKCAKGHICRSEGQKFARILPYPPPLELLGAKTNHLPNIQGSPASDPLQNGARNQNLRSKLVDSSPPKNEIRIILSSSPKAAFHRAVSEGYSAL